MELNVSLRRTWWPRARRGVFFSIAAVIFLAILTIIVTESLRTPVIDTGSYSVRSTGAMRERIEGVYLPMIVRATSAQTLVALSDDAYQNSRYLVLPRDFAQALENGTYGGGANIPLSTQTLTEALDALSNATNATGVNLTIRADNASIVQIGSFTAQVRVHVNFTLRSADDSVRYNRSLFIVTTIPLQGVVDVYYSRGARAKGFADPERRFRAQLPRSWNNVEFQRTWDNNLYALDDRSPSVFNRLEGNTGGALYGVESFVPFPVAPPNNLSSLDVEYFSNTNLNCTYSVPGLTGARVSFITLTEYNLTNGSSIQGGVNCPVAPTWP